MMKLDPYLNVDPGTMNPFQHGEVFFKRWKIFIEYREIFVER